MPNPTSGTPATPVTPATPAKAPAATDPKAQVAAVTESVKTGKPASVAPAEDTWEVVVDGKPEKKSRKEILEAYQLRQLSDKKRAEADKTMQEYQRVFAEYKKDPIKFMKATGIDFDNLATSYLAKKAEDSMRDPKDVELAKAREEADTYKKWVEEQKAGQEKAQKDAAIAAERSKLHAEIIQAIEEAKELGMPVDEELIIAVAQKMILQDKKQKPLNAKEALPKAYESTQKWLRGMASKMDGEKLVKWLGDDTALKIRKYDLAQLKAKRAATAPAPSAAVKQNVDRTAVTAPKYKTWSQFKAEKLDTMK